MGYFTLFFRTMKARKVEKVVLSVEQSEGVGARVRRSIGRREVGWFIQRLLFENISVNLTVVHS